MMARARISGSGTAKARATASPQPSMAAPSLRFALLPGARSLVAALLAIALAALLALPALAWADEEGQANSNRVYVNQLPDSSFLYQTSIADLAKADSYYEGQTVLVQGEVVGDRINDEMQGGNCWITLQDSDAANPSVVSVFMTMEQSNVIDSYGHFGMKGTELQVRGTFHLECAEHQGMSDIHVEELAALASGEAEYPQVNMHILVAGVLAVIAGAALLYVYHKKREGTL